MNTRIISIALMLLYIPVAFSIYIPILSYALNYDFIVKELCEKRMVKNNKCHGKCHLVKEIDKEMNGKPAEHNNTTNSNRENISPHLTSDKTANNKLSFLETFFRHEKKETLSRENIIDPPPPKIS